MIAKLLGAVAVVVVAVLVVLFAVPIDPIERIPGTRLAGELAADQNPDWSGYTRRQIAVETRTGYGIPHSVTTTSWVTDGEFYVPCARCEGKRWPGNVARDDRVRLKIDGEIYERRAVRITDAEERLRVLGAVGRDGRGGTTAVFRMEPR